MENKTHIIKDIASSSGSQESRKIYVITTIHSGETEVVIDYQVSKRMPIQEYNEAMNIFDKLGKTPRRCISLEDILDLQFTPPINGIKH